MSVIAVGAQVLASIGIGTVAGVAGSLLVEQANKQDAVWKRWFSSEILARHTAHKCLYAPGAEERIAAKITDATTLDEIYAMHDAEEIYCPREGIDKRAEFGIAVHARHVELIDASAN